MRTPKGWSKRAIQTCCGEVEAIVHGCGWLAYHKAPWADEPYSMNKAEAQAWLTVTHVPTGLAITNIRTQSAAQQIITSCAHLRGVDTSSPTQSAVLLFRDTVSAELSRLQAAGRAQKRTAPASSTSDTALKISPVWEWVPTPKQRAAGQMAADSINAVWAAKTPEGQQEAYEEMLEELTTLAAVTWREEIMVRIVQGAKAPLLETDVPKSRPTISVLLDGSSVSHETFRKKYADLISTGDRLQTGAVKMMGLYVLGSANGWTNDSLSRWEKMDERFTALVQEGWMCWSGAAYCYAHASDRFKANVQAKIGFVGDDRRGYHALAEKTFLRHPELAECREMRREMRQRIAREL